MGTAGVASTRPIGDRGSRWDAKWCKATGRTRPAGAVVGLHYHLHQADYWQCARGTARVILHDFRLGSPTEGATQTLEISEDNRRGVFIPPGVAHGFASLTDVTMTYLVDSYYNPDDELGVAWDDPEVGGRLGCQGPDPVGP